MNPLVEKMLIAQREGIDARTLEQIFEHEAKCESDHHYTPQCSGDVTYHLESCARNYNSCKSHVEDSINGARIRMSRDLCAGCNNLASECWTIRPI